MIRRLSIVATLLSLAAFTRAASADIMQVESLDLAVMRSAVVVHGKVVKVVSEIERKSDLVDTVTVEIEEVIKGPDALRTPPATAPNPAKDQDSVSAKPRITFVVRSYVALTTNPIALSWRNMESDMLFCLDNHDEKIMSHITHGRADYVLRPNWGSWAVALDAQRGHLGVYTAGNKTLQTGPEILAAARVAAQRPVVEKEFNVVCDSAIIMTDGMEILYPDTPDLRAAEEARKKAAATRPAK